MKTYTEACNFIKKERLRHRCFSVNFAKFSRTSFLQNTFGRLLLTFSLFIKLGKCQQFEAKSKNNCPEVFCKEGVLRNFVKFTGKLVPENLGLQLY